MKGSWTSLLLLVSIVADARGSSRFRVARPRRPGDVQCVTGNEWINNSQVGADDSHDSCSKAHDFCRTWVMLKDGAVSMVQRGCATECEEYSQDWGYGRIYLSRCCQEDRCNNRTVPYGIPYSEINLPEQEKNLTVSNDSSLFYPGWYWESHGSCCWLGGTDEMVEYGSWRDDLPPATDAGYQIFTMPTNIVLVAVLTAIL